MSERSHNLNERQKLSAGDATDFFREEEGREERERKAAQAEKDLDNAIASLMSSRQNRAVIRWILSLTGHDVSCTSTDFPTMAIMSARRDVGLAIIDRIRAVVPVLYRQMDEENNG